MMASVMVPASFAATTVDISDNGALSTNRVRVRNTSTKTVNQTNTTYATTTVNAKAKTGKNTSSFNTGGTSSIITGAASNTVTVGVTGGSNSNSGDECGCPSSETDVTISGNGALSTNTVKVWNNNSSTVNQSNTTNATTTVTTTASTGGNNSSFNTGGDSSIDTGPATNHITVTVGGSTNTN